MIGKEGESIPLFLKAGDEVARVVHAPGRLGSLLEFGSGSCFLFLGPRKDRQKKVVIIPRDTRLEINFRKVRHPVDLSR